MMAKYRALRNGTPNLVTSGSEEINEKKKGVTRQQIIVRGIPTTRAIKRPPLSGKHPGSVEPSPLLRATSPCTAGVIPITKANTSVLLKTDNPAAAMAWFPNVPTMARSINDIIKVKLRAMPTGNANLEIVVIRSLVSMKTPLKFIDCFRKRQLAEAEPRRNVIEYELGSEAVDSVHGREAWLVRPDTLASRGIATRRSCVTASTACRRDSKIGWLEKPIEVSDYISATGLAPRRIR